MSNGADITDDHYIAGAHGTLAPQMDEAYYDDRSDADDDLEKGRITFPTNVLYGREKELDKLRTVYDGLADVSSRDEHGDDDDVQEDKKEEVDASAGTSSDPYKDSRVVFLSGYR